MFPELVVFGANGEPGTVKYRFLSTLLLNEVQKQDRALKEQRRENDDLRVRVAALETVVSR